LLSFEPVAHVPNIFLCETPPSD